MSGRNVLVVAPGHLWGRFVAAKGGTPGTVRCGSVEAEGVRYTRVERLTHLHAFDPASATVLVLDDRDCDKLLAHFALMRFASEEENVESLFARTPAERVATLLKVLNAERKQRLRMLQRADGNKVDYWTGRVSEVEAAIADVKALAEELGVGVPSTSATDDDER